MVRKSRVPMQVSPEFREGVKKLQTEIRKVGKDASLRDLTAEIVKSNAFHEIEKKLVESNSSVDIKIKFDKRIFQ